MAIAAVILAMFTASFIVNTQTNIYKAEAEVEVQNTEISEFLVAPTFHSFAFTVNYFFTSTLIVDAEFDNYQIQTPQFFYSNNLPLFLAERSIQI